MHVIFSSAFVRATRTLLEGSERATHLRFKVCYVCYIKYIKVSTKVLQYLPAIFHVFMCVNVHVDRLRCSASGRMKCEMKGDHAALFSRNQLPPFLCVFLFSTFVQYLDKICAFLDATSTNPVHHCIFVDEKSGLTLTLPCVCAKTIDFFSLVTPKT